MESTKIIQEKINRYLSNQMTEEEVHLFCTEVEQNPALKTTLEENYIAREAVASYQKPTTEELKLRDSLVKNSENKVRRRQIQTISKAATILLVIVGSVFIATQYIKDTTKTAPALADKFYQPIKVGTLSGPNPTNNPINLLWQEIVSSYKKDDEANCKIVQEKVKELVNLDKNSEKIYDAYLLSGTCIYQYAATQNDFKEAIEVLEMIPDKGFTKLYYDAQWYIAMAKLKKNDSQSIKDAKRILTMLPPQIDTNKSPSAVLDALEAANL